MILATKIEMLQKHRSHVKYKNSLQILITHTSLWQYHRRIKLKQRILEAPPSSPRTKMKMRKQEAVQGQEPVKITNHLREPQVTHLNKDRNNNAARLY